MYERLYHGSLDRVLYERSDGPPIDWNARMKVASCAAQGLTFLHDEGPFQVIRTLKKNNNCNIFEQSWDDNSMDAISSCTMAYSSNESSFYDRQCFMSFQLQIYKLTKILVQNCQDMVA